MNTIVRPRCSVPQAILGAVDTNVVSREETQGVGSPTLLHFCISTDQFGFERFCPLGPRGETSYEEPAAFIRSPYCQEYFSFTDFMPAPTRLVERPGKKSTLLY